MRVNRKGRRAKEETQQKTKISKYKIRGVVLQLLIPSGGEWMGGYPQRTHGNKQELGPGICVYRLFVSCYAFR